MPARTTRQEARARTLAAFRALLGRILPEDEQVPLKEATLADFEDQIEDLARAALPVALEQRAAWEPNAPVGYDTGSDGALDEIIYSEDFGVGWFSLTFGTESYDAAGNLLKDALYEYTYDAWNRLVKVERRAGCQAQYKALAVYRYDGIGRRIYKDVSNSGGRDGEQWFYYNNRWQLLEVRNDQDKATRQFVWGPRYIDEAITMYVDGDGDGVCTDFTDTGTNPAGGAERWYYMQDANWNVVRLWSDTVTAGLKSERYEYDPYGTTRVVAGYDTALAAERLHVMPASLADNPIRYAGYFYDEETGNYKVRFRDLEPQLSRWMEAELLGYVDGMNRYEYVRSMPGAALDPLGLAFIGYDPWAPLSSCPQPGRAPGPLPLFTGSAGPIFAKYVGDPNSSFDDYDLIGNFVHRIRPRYVPVWVQRFPNCRPGSYVTAVNFTVNVGTVFLLSGYMSVGLTTAEEQVIVSTSGVPVPMFGSWLRPTNRTFWVQVPECSCKTVVFYQLVYTHTFSAWGWRYEYGPVDWVRELPYGPAPWSLILTWDEYTPYILPVETTGKCK